MTDRAPGPLLIRGCDALVAPGEVQEDVDLAIEGGRILALTPCAPVRADESRQVLDGRGLVAVPGLINAHTHSAENCLRGAGEGLALEPWLARMFMTSGPFTPEEHYVCALAGAVEMVLTGVTAVLDHLWGTPVTAAAVDAVLRAYREVGIRCAVAPLVADADFTGDLAASIGHDSAGILFTDLAGPCDPAEAASQLEELVSRWHDPEAALAQVFAGPCGVQWCSDELLVRLSETAARYDTGLTIHLLETSLQCHIARHRFGVSAVEGIDRLGVLGPRCSLAHGVWLTDGDLELIAERGATVIHNPAANLRLGSGRAPVPEMLGRGVTVALGADGSACSDNQVLWTQLKLTALVHNDFAAGRWIHSSQALAMATAGGAAALGLEGRLGRLSPGMLADLVLVDRSGQGLAGAHELEPALVLSETGRGVIHVIVGGRPVVLDGQCVNVDEPGVRRRLREQAARRASNPGSTPSDVQSAMERLKRLKRAAEP